MHASDLIRVPFLFPFANELFVSILFLMHFFNKLFSLFGLLCLRLGSIGNCRCHIVAHGHALVHFLPEIADILFDEFLSDVGDEFSFLAVD